MIMKSLKQLDFFDAFNKKPSPPLLTNTPRLIIPYTLDPSISLGDSKEKLEADGMIGIGKIKKRPTYYGIKQVINSFHYDPVRLCRYYRELKERGFDIPPNCGVWKWCSLSQAYQYLGLFGIGLVDKTSDDKRFLSSSKNGEEIRNVRNRNINMPRLRKAFTGSEDNCLTCMKEGFILEFVMRDGEMIRVMYELHHMNFVNGMSIHKFDTSEDPSDILDRYDLSLTKNFHKLIDVLCAVPLSPTAHAYIHKRAKKRGDINDYTELTWFLKSIENFKAFFADYNYPCPDYNKFLFAQASGWLEKNKAIIDKSLTAKQKIEVYLDRVM